MPQVDLETLVLACAGGSSDRKIGCETLVPIAAYHSNHQPTESQSDQPDLPPESFRLSKGAELDWFDRKAFIGRKVSTKGNSTNLNPNSLWSNCQRFSNLKSKASIIGLPVPQKSCFVDAKNRRHFKPGSRLFMKRSGSHGKSDSLQVEPSSPKVSCIGRVKSKRDRNRTLRNRKGSTGTDWKKKKRESEQKDGFFASLRAIFSPGTKQTHNKDKNDQNDASQNQSLPRNGATGRTSDIKDRLPAADRDEAANPSKSVGRNAADWVERADLCRLERFASGRKSDLSDSAILADSGARQSGRRKT